MKMQTKVFNHNGENVYIEMPVIECSSGGVISYNGITFKDLSVKIADKEVPAVDELPSDVKRVIFSNNTTVVELTNGKRGVCKCSNGDTFDPFVGFTIAYYKAKHNKNYALAEIFKGVVSYADNKGHKQAILNNYKNNKKK